MAKYYDVYWYEIDWLGHYRLRYSLIPYATSTSTL